MLLFSLRCVALLYFLFHTQQCTYLSDLKYKHYKAFKKFVPNLLLIIFGYHHLNNLTVIPFSNFAFRGCVIKKEQLRFVKSEERPQKSINQKSEKKSFMETFFTDDTFPIAFFLLYLKTHCKKETVVN